MRILQKFLVIRFRLDKKMKINSEVIQEIFHVVARLLVQRLTNEEGELQSCIILLWRNAPEPGPSWTCFPCSPQVSA